MGVFFNKYVTAFLKPGTENCHSVEKSFSKGREKNAFDEKKNQET